MVSASIGLPLGQRTSQVQTYQMTPAKVGSALRTVRWSRLSPRGGSASSIWRGCPAWRARPHTDPWPTWGSSVTPRPLHTTVGWQQQYTWLTRSWRVRYQAGDSPSLLMMQASLTAPTLTLLTSRVTERRTFSSSAPGLCQRLQRKLRMVVTDM